MKEDVFKKFKSTLCEVHLEEGESALRYRGNDNKLHYVPSTESNPSNYFAKSSDVSANNISIADIKADIEKVLNALKASSFEGSSVPSLSWVSDVYSITNTLSHATTSNPVLRVSNGDSFITTIAPASGYEFGDDAVSVTMGGDTITSSAYDSSTGEVSISEVTGNLVITASGTEIQSGEGK